MKLKQHRKHRKFVSSAVSLLLIFTMIFSFSVYEFADTPDFTGTIPTEAEKTHYRKTENTYLLKKKKSALRYIIKMTNIRKKKLKYIDMMERIVL